MPLSAPRVWPCSRQVALTRPTLIGALHHHTPCAYLSQAMTTAGGAAASAAASAAPAAADPAAAAAAASASAAARAQ